MQHKDKTLSKITRYLLLVAIAAFGLLTIISTNCGDGDTTDITLPSVPNELTATAISNSEIILTWSASTDDAKVVGYKVHRDGNYIASVVDTVEFTDAGLNPVTTYCYTVSAYDAADNESETSIEECATTWAGWVKTFGGLGYDGGHSVQQVSDGGYIFTGYIMPEGDNWWDVYLVKTDSGGNPLWEKTYGGINHDEGYSVQQTIDGGYIVAGTTHSSSAGTAYLIKTDPEGSILWENYYGDDEYIYKAKSVQQTSDGGYIIAGTGHLPGATWSDASLIKTDSDGNPLWEKTFGGSSPDDANSVRQTDDGGYIVAGYTKTYAAGNYDFYLIKTDSSGNALWEKTYGGEGWDYSYSVWQTSDGGYIVAGNTSPDGSTSDGYVVKTDSEGNIIWEKTFGGTDSDYLSSVQQTSDGSYILAGSTNSYGAGSNDCYLVKTDADGNILWEKTVGETRSDRCSSVQQTVDGGYVLIGSTWSYGECYPGECYPDIYLVKTDENGNVR